MPQIVARPCLVSAPLGSARPGVKARGALSPRDLVGTSLPGSTREAAGVVVLGFLWVLFS